MIRGALTGYIDVAQVTLYAFFIFFAGLIYYLRREDKREGYPLESERSGAIKVQGFPSLPKAKTFELTHGGTYSAPSGRIDRRIIAAEPIGPWLGAALHPTGNPMKDGVGPASYAERDEAPELNLEGQPLIVPMRLEPEFTIFDEDADPRGMSVIGADKVVAGIVREAWVDRGEPQIRYLEVDLAGLGSRLLPIYFAAIDGRRRTIKVNSILARQFADVPPILNPDQVTKREEDKITAYYASGYLYATPSRLGPIL